MDTSGSDNPRLEAIRRRYAANMLSAANVNNPRLQAAIASIPRERFLGEPPWQFVSMRDGYKKAPSADPALAYQDVLFALAPNRGLNNGSPSLHAALLHALDVQPGDRVVHVGAGTGYYTAILAHLTGPGGTVLAIEFDPALAERAATSLADISTVAVRCADGAAWPTEPTDCLYVSFAVTRPAAAWIENLAPGGRLILPIGVLPRRRRGRLLEDERGAVFLIERQQAGFSARVVTLAFFVHAAGLLSAPAGEEANLRRAFRQGGAGLVRSLVWRGPAKPERCWFHSPTWSLSQDPVCGV